MKAVQLHDWGIWHAAETDRAPTTLCGVKLTGRRELSWARDGYLPGGNSDESLRCTDIIATRTTKTAGTAGTSAS